MTGPGGEAPGTTKMHVVGVVWGGVGVVALVVALVTSSIVVAVFGGLAVVAGGGLYAGQTARLRSAAETRQVLTGPVDPYPEPDPYPGPEPYPEPGPDADAEPGPYADPDPDPGPDADAGSERSGARPPADRDENG